MGYWKILSKIPRAISRNILESITAGIIEIVHKDIFGSFQNFFYKFLGKNHRNCSRNSMINITEISEGTPKEFPEEFVKHNLEHHFLRETSTGVSS